MQAGEGERAEDRFEAAIEAIYSAAAAPSHWPQALQSIADCLDDVGALMLYQRDNGSLGTIASPALEAAQRDYEVGGWWRQDIRFARAAERGYLASTDAVTERHVTTHDEVENHPFYVQFLRPRGLKWFAGTAISPEPHVQVAIAVQRSASKPAYADPELIRLARLGRHVERALRVGIRLIDEQATNIALGDLLARLGVGVFLVDESGCVLFMNPAAQHLARGSLAIVQERITAPLTLENEALKAAIADAVHRKPYRLNEDPKPVLLHDPATSQLFAAHVLPVATGSRESEDRLLAGVRAIVAVTTSDARQPADPTIVRDLLGLTLGEARVAALVGAGVAPTETAQLLGIPERSVRWALKRVFQKAGVSRQSELVALLTKLVLR